MQTEPRQLQAGLASPQASIRSRAARVLKLLGLEGGEAAARPGAPAAAGQPAPVAAAAVPDLLGGLDEGPPAHSAQDMLGGHPAALWSRDPVHTWARCHGLTGRTRAAAPWAEHAPCCALAVHGGIGTATKSAGAQQGCS